MQITSSIKEGHEEIIREYMRTKLGNRKYETLMGLLSLVNMDLYNGPLYIDTHGEMNLSQMGYMNYHDTLVFSMWCEPDAEALDFSATVALADKLLNDLPSTSLYIEAASDCLCETEPQGWYEECYDCDGKGESLVIDEDGEELVECDTCDGSGKLWEDTLTYYSYEGVREIVELLKGRECAAYF